jgi:UTP--glucose-1-phosphate uridylyltransferase
LFIKKAVIPVAGLGIRLLPMTKELPKEMLPIFSKGREGNVLLKPMLQEVFEQLYCVGFREFCFIVGRGKRAIEDHFTPDWEFMKYVKGRGNGKAAEEIAGLYKKIENSKIVFIRQPEPKGFGDAVHKAEFFTGNEPFLVHAGDDFVYSPEGDHLKRIMKIFEFYDASAVLLVEKVEDASMYGVIAGKRVKKRLYQVMKVVEKPRRPPTNLATIAISAYGSAIHNSLKKCEPDKRKEIQLTSAVQQLIQEGHKVYAVELEPHEKRIDIGGPEKYSEALRISLRAINYSSRRISSRHSG